MAYRQTGLKKGKHSSGSITIRRVAKKRVKSKKKSEATQKGPEIERMMGMKY
jgi:hypothetical protein